MSNSVVIFVFRFWLSSQSPDNHVCQCEINVGLDDLDGWFKFAAEQSVSTSPAERALYDPAMR